MSFFKKLSGLTHPKDPSMRPQLKLAVPEVRWARHQWTVRRYGKETAAEGNLLV